MKTLIIRILIICGLLNSLHLFCQSNEGTEFWLGFMEHRDEGENTMVVMITSRVNTTGVISIPGRGFSRNFSVQANNVTLFELPRFVETLGSEFINNNAVQILTNDPSSVYMHQYFGMRSEASVVLPKSSVGNAYYVVTYTGVPTGASFDDGQYPSEFLIVANEDETIINYTLTGRTQRGRSEGSRQTVTLNKGEVYQVRSDDALTDLTGTLVEADKDFSLFAGTPWSQVPLGCFAMDNLLEQMYPISTWGTRYVASPFFGTSEDLYRIIASENNTLVVIEGNKTESVVLQAGEYYDFNASKGAFIEGSRPISVAQYIIGSACNGDIGDPSMVILNTVEQIRDTVTLFNSRFQNILENYINVISKAGEEDLIFMDGVNLVGDRGVVFNSIGSEGKFSFASIPTTEGAHTIFSEGCGIIAMAYGYGDIESYAYSGGASFNDINENPIPEGGCLNDTIFFDTGLPSERYRVAWDLGDGTKTVEHKFTQMYSELGSYPLELIIEDLCFDEIDTITRDALVTLRQDMSVIDDQSGCEGSDITLGAFDLSGARFEWSGPNDFEAEEQFPKLRNTSVEQGGLYEVVGNISGCKTFPEEIGVEVFENPLPFIGKDTVICAADGDEIILNAENYITYEWQDGSSLSEFTADVEGIYTVKVADLNNCFGSDSIVIVQQCPTRLYVANAFSPNDDGINDLFGVSGLDIRSMKFVVFDRWGQMVFFTENESVKWNGTFEQQEVAQGEYAWVLEYEGFREDASIFREVLTGSVLLIR